MFGYGTHAYAINHVLFRTFLQYTKKNDFGIMLEIKDKRKVL